MEKTPAYIQNLLRPTAKAPQGRKVWSVDLDTVWLPFFFATNTMGDTAIPHDALGSPLRLGYSKDGAVKFNANGRPVIRVAKEIQDSVKLVRENFTANLRQYAVTVQRENKDGYKTQLDLAVKAGQPIKEHDKAELDKAIQLQLKQAMAESEKNATEPEPEPEPEKTPEPEPKNGNKNKVLAKA